MLLILFTTVSITLHRSFQYCLMTDGITVFTDRYIYKITINAISERCMILTFVFNRIVSYDSDCAE
jgi:hypothetical protein